MEKLTLHVEGMSCGHCEIAVKDAVRKLPGIKKVKANQRKKEVKAEYDPALTSADAIIETITETGYDVIR